MRLKIKLLNKQDLFKAKEIEKLWEYNTIIADNYLFIDTTEVQAIRLNIGEFKNETELWRKALNILYYSHVFNDNKINKICLIIIKISLIITLICLIYPFRTYWLLLIALGIEIYNLIKTIWKN